MALTNFNTQGKPAIQTTSVITVLKRDSVTRLIFFLKVKNILFSTFCVCNDGFKVFQKLLTSLYNYKLFNCLFDITC